MTIEKKSLISTLKTTKKANAVKDEFGTATVSPAQKSLSTKRLSTKRLSTKRLSTKRLSTKRLSTKRLGVKTHVI